MTYAQFRTIIPYNHFYSTTLSIKYMKGNIDMNKREGFDSRLGFILVSAGCAIGIGNVCGRLELYFGRSDLLDIKSDGEDSGTEVIICIPKTEG